MIWRAACLRRLRFRPVLGALLPVGLLAPTLAIAGGGAGEAASLTGIVVDHQGRGVEGASVFLEEDPARPRDSVAARTEASGSFEVRGLKAGRVLLRVEHPDFAPAVVPEVAVGPGADRATLRITLLRGGRVEGAVRHRDGRPFTAGRVIVQSSSPAAAFAPPTPVAPDEGGRFAVDHIPPGSARVYVLAFTPGRGPREAARVATLSPIATATARSADGETTTVDVDLRDVVVSGRVTRGNRGLGGVRVTLSGPSESISFPGMPAPPPVEPPMLTATTREDGTYEVVAFAPGPARVSLSEAGSGRGLAVRETAVADADRFALDVEVTEAPVSGIVVREEDETPLPDVLVTLRPAAGGGEAPVRGRSSADGRFSIGVPPGDYLLRAEVLGRVPASRAVDVSIEGLDGLRVAMGRGRSISGRLVDEGGRPVSGAAVFASGADGFERAQTRGDGRFRLEGLGDGPYALSAGAPLVGFAVRPGVRSGPEPVTLALAAGGRIALRVLGPEGTPAAHALATALTLDGARLDPGLCAAPPTDDSGRTVLVVPAGEVGVAAQAEGVAAFATLTVRARETVTVDLRLERPRHGAEGAPRP